MMKCDEANGGGLHRSSFRSGSETLMWWWHQVERGCGLGADGGCPCQPSIYFPLERRLKATSPDLGSEPKAMSQTQTRPETAVEWAEDEDEKAR